MAIRDLVRRRSGQPRTQENDNPLTALQREMNQLFNSFWSTWPMSLTRGAEELSHFGLRVDVSETEETVEVTAELPGLHDKDLHVELSPNRDSLYLRGEKRDEREERHKHFYSVERSFGSFHRTVPLPHVVSGQQIEATFRDGVLTMTLPKSTEESERARRIEIKP